MNEVQDLKNHILALDYKLNSFFDAVKGSVKTNENVNEILNLIHNLGFERSKQNATIFENIFPEILSRLASLEDKERNRIMEGYKEGDWFELSLGKGKGKDKKFHVRVTKNGLRTISNSKIMEINLIGSKESK